MPTTYNLADTNTVAAVKQIMSLYHQSLVEAGVRVGVIFALNDTGPAVKKDGYPKGATISLVGAKDKVSKPYEAEMLIDETVWDEMNENQRSALLDHTLTYLELTPDTKDDAELPYKVDEKGRACLRLRLGDFQGGVGFTDVITRHKDNSIELLALNQCLQMAHRAKDKHSE